MFMGRLYGGECGQHLVVKRWEKSWRLGLYRRDELAQLDVLVPVPSGDNGLLVQRRLTLFPKYTRCPLNGRSCLSWTPIHELTESFYVVFG